MTLYAQWTALPNHTVIFNNNGGTGAMANEVNNVAAALTTDTFTRAGFTFAGWNTVGDVYADGASYPFTADVTLFAQWTALPNHTVIFNNNGGTGVMTNEVNNVAAALTTNSSHSCRVQLQWLEHLGEWDRYRVRGRCVVSVHCGRDSLCTVDRSPRITP